MFGVLAVVGVGIASAATNHGFRQYILSQWLTRVVTGLPARAVAILAFAATLLTGIPAFVCVRKFLRSWWSGLHSLLVPTGVVLAWAILAGTLTDLKVLTAIVFVLLVFEISRWRVDYSRVAFPLPVFPICGAQAETLWRQKRDDDSIKNPREDLIGRTATLELLARCALQDRMPIVALKGAYGDGKTSVLNLLEQPLSKSALVVPFKSWLTGSEAGLVGALLRDISLTVNKHLYVPKLRRRTLAFLRIITGTASQLGGIKEIIPIHTQADEFRELASTLKRVPRPVVVLLDELDRMEAGEALALFKLLRGASALPNLTFICTFSETDLRRIVGSVAGGSEDYLEKFFPASIRLPAPTGDLLGRSLLDRLILFLRRQKAFQSADEQKCFREDFEKVWNDCLQHVVRNLRRAGRLAIEVEMAHAPVGGEVEPLDVILLEALRLAFPEIHEKVRLSGDRLTDMQTLDPLAVVEEQSKKFIQELELLVAPKPEAHHILGWLFPDYDKRRQFAYKRAWEKTERRAWRSDRFQIYFRSAVPGEIFSEAETREIMDALRGSNGLEAARRIL